MDKFGNLKISDLITELTAAARKKSQEDGLKEKTENDGLIAIGLQPISEEAKDWSRLDTGDKFVLYFRPLYKRGKIVGKIGRRFQARIESIERDMESSTIDRGRHIHLDDWSVDSDLGSACSFEIKDFETNKLHMRIGIFVSGDADFARECCYAAHKELQLMILKHCQDTRNDDGTVHRTIYTPASWRNMAIPSSTASAIAS